MLSYWHTSVLFCLFWYVCSTHGMHSLCTHTLHNSETLEHLTWTRVCPSHCCEHTLMCSHVLYCLYLTSVNIRRSNQLLKFVIPYIIIATVLILFWVHNFSFISNGRSPNSCHNCLHLQRQQHESNFKSLSKSFFFASLVLSLLSLAV